MNSINLSGQLFCLPQLYSINRKTLVLWIMVKFEFPNLFSCAEKKPDEHAGTYQLLPEVWFSSAAEFGL